MKETIDDLMIKDPEFDIPQGYFDTLSDRLLERIAQNRPQQPVRTVRTRSIARWWYAAAALTALAAGIGLAFHLDRSSGEIDRFAVGTQEVQQYLAEWEYALDPTAATAELQDEDSPLETYLLDYTDADQLIYLEQNDNLYALNCSELEQYIIDNYNIMELAAL